MRFKTIPSLLLCGLLFAVGCNTASNGSSEETATTPSTTPGGATSEADMQGNGQYTTTTIDTTIKSPRKELTGTIDGVQVTINYGSPSVNERTIFGDLVPYGQVWRTGANEATRITFSEDVLFGEEQSPVPAGTYSLFTLPNSKEDWTIILNKTADQWGAYDYSEGDDLVRVKGMSEPAATPAERMDFALDGGEIELMWSDLVVSFPVNPAAR
ncbi:Protein of unknown function (DUF2911) [Neolewinella xylanilytica]|uniref:DUF2911 family protein n=1 Tax=Neolewinella xylanilytica TaxID=1514080 RepID=A0A2S6I3Y5_9BACT|nr:DUF2911 domain-containing protein [Neolewinella xylanilytica]PPK85771.1 Protein of unknown function (DUF2911) [Neolewinella xylanilytica]